MRLTCLNARASRSSKIIKYWTATPVRIDAVRIMRLTWRSL